MKDESDKEFNLFLKDVRAEWKKLDKNAQAELANNQFFMGTLQMINGKLG
jgi:hypothetical protein